MGASWGAGTFHQTESPFAAVRGSVCHSGTGGKQSVDISSVNSRLGKKTIELEHVCKGYNGVEYIHDFSYIILRNDRVGITGNNGCGKTTLLKMMTGQLQPDSGTVTRGETVKIGVLPRKMKNGMKISGYWIISEMWQSMCLQ